MSLTTSAKPSITRRSIPFPGAMRRTAGKESAATRPVIPNASGGGAALKGILKQIT